MRFVSEKPAEVVRPNLLQWLRYTFIGSVPRKNHAWVLYDATCSTWLVRHAVRYLVLISPLIVAVLLLLPTSLQVRVEACVAAGGSLLIGYMCFTTESLERRIEKAGYRYGLAARMREQRANDAQRAVVARNRARYEARRYGHR
jgi:Family of unknown function (DUF5313)